MAESILNRRLLRALEQPSGPSLSRAQMAELFLREAAYRRMHPLAIYQPTPVALEFHKTDCPERLGIGSNRSGKTTTCAIEFAMAVLGKHKYINYPKQDGRAILVAKDNVQIAEVLYRKLFRPGLFRMLKDADTGAWRIYEPWRDEARFSETKPSMPLITHRMIEEVVWENKKQRVPRLIRLTNGWELLFFSSLGKPPQGIDVDLAWFDEEIKDGDWYPEVAARLIDRGGRFLWSATPQSATETLHDCHERAEKDRNHESPIIKEFIFLLANNPYLSERDKLKFARKFEDDPEQYRVRVEGQWLILSYLVYPNFSMQKHGVDQFDIPKDWCRYMVVDPSYANTTAIFYAVPPDEDHIYVYDELYLHSTTAYDFAKVLHDRFSHQTFQEFVIDRCGSRKHETNGKTIQEQFAEQLAAFNIRSIGTGSNFLVIGPEGRDENELMAGIDHVRSWLWDRDNKPPFLRVMRGVCPQFVQEMTRYRNKKDSNKPEQRKWSHGPDTLRYMRERGAVYFEPKKLPKKGNPIQNFLREKQRKKRQKDGNFVLLG